MDVKTYRARSMQEALALVRRDLGPDAAVLHTREMSGGMLRWLLGGRQIEVTASATVKVPSRLPAEELPEPEQPPRSLSRDHRESPTCASQTGEVSGVEAFDFRAKFRGDIRSQLDHLHSMVEDLCRTHSHQPRGEMPDSTFRLYTDLIDAEVSEELARELIDRVRSSGRDGDDPLAAKSRIARMLEDEIQIAGPIRVTPGERRLVALVGPTGVGKTTTIAKLAANFRLREKRRVGLITVDTYRIAAVEQLRTYADIIDLPMEVVSTPREMRQAVNRLGDMELVLLDTAGRSPRDEVKIQELKSMLAEARADEVHLVLSSAAGSQGMIKTAASFAEVGATSLLLTKLDEATGLGNLLPLLRSCRLPLSYITNGQNVPDDIQPADARRLARMVLGLGTRDSGIGSRD
jgi:flagellar biosynthesis protein FlhF